MPARPSGGNNVPGRGRRPGCSLRWTRQPSPVLGGDALLPAARPSKAPPSMPDSLIIAVPKGRILDEELPLLAAEGDRKSVVEGKRVSVRVELGGGGVSTKNITDTNKIDKEK